MNKTQVAQFILSKAGLYKGEIDGDFGPLSIESANEYYNFPSDWGNGRISIGVLQVYAIRNGISTGVLDGFWGNNTSIAYSKILKLLDIKEETTISVNQNVRVKPVYNTWPSQNYNELVAFYGKVGTNQTSLSLPYEMVLAWDTSTKIKRFTCHEKIKRPLERIFSQTLEHYGLETLKELRLHYFGGCLNVRRMRGGSSWSMHSWGIAVDLDPDRNRLRWGKDKAVFAKPEYEPFWKIVEAEGATSLGRKRNMDFMHFQFANI